MYDTNSADDGIARQRLRRLEQLAMVATVAVILATYALVGTAHGREANPVMGAVLDLAGWPAFAAAKLVVTAGVFALARRAVDLERRGTTRAALAGAGTFTLLMVLNAGHDLALLADVWPVGLRWGTSLGYAGAVAGVALVLVVRPDPRPLLDEIVSASRDVTSGLSKPDTTAARSVLLVAILLLATISGAVTFGPLPAAHTAAADSEIIDDLEDTDMSEWTSGTERNTTRSIEGDASARIGTDGNQVTESRSITETSPSSLTLGWYLKRTGGGNDVKWKSGSTRMVEVQHNDVNHNYGYNISRVGSNKIYEDASEGWYVVQLKNIDYTANTFDFYLKDKDGNILIENKSASFQNDVSSIDTFSVRGQAHFVDYLTQDGAGSSLFGVKVDGTVTDSDGNAIDSGTVELRQSGSVQQSATPNSSGGYSFSGVSDGDYTVRASASGYENASKDITVSGSPRTVDLTLNEEGTFTREFQLGPDASQTYPPSLSRLELYRFDRAIEFPLPGGTTFEAGPGTWTQVETAEFNSQGAAYARLEDGEPYRVDVIATSGARQTRWESLGWLANASRPDPYGITVGSSDTATPTATSTGTATSPTATPTGGGVPTVEYPDLAPPSDPFDFDDDGEYFDEPDGSGGNVSAPAGGDGFGPRLVGDCLTADGTSGVLLEYWDPTYSTSSLEYNVSAGGNSYAGERTFDTPAGYATWCVADTLTDNGSDTDTGLTGNVTRNGTTTNFSDTLEESAVFGGPVGGGGGGEPSTSQRLVGIGLSAGAAYLLARRFTEFRISEALSSVASRLPIGGGGS